MKISYCVTCRNRLWQLSETLLENLKCLEQFDYLDICLVDFGSKDGLSEFIWQKFSTYIYSGRLNFFEVKNEISWHASKAKNLAHRISNSDYLFNLDADNFLTYEDILQHKNSLKNGDMIHQFSGDWYDGSCGRIGLPSYIFYDVGGYDESLLPMGAQDLDLIERYKAKYMKDVCLLGPPLKPSIVNNNKQRIMEFVSDEKMNFYDREYINIINMQYSEIRRNILGPVRLNNFSTYIGKLNGRGFKVDGISKLPI